VFVRASLIRFADRHRIDLLLLDGSTCVSMLIEFFRKLVRMSGGASCRGSILGNADVTDIWLSTPRYARSRYSWRSIHAIRTDDAAAVISSALQWWRSIKRAFMQTSARPDAKQTRR